MKALLRQSRKDTSSIDWFVSAIGAPETVPARSIKGKLSWGTTTLNIRDFEIEDERHDVFSMNFILGARAAFSFSSRSTAVGVA